MNKTEETEGGRKAVGAAEGGKASAAEGKTEGGGRKAVGVAEGGKASAAEGKAEGGGRKAVGAAEGGKASAAEGGKAVGAAEGGKTEDSRRKAVGLEDGKAVLEKRAGRREGVGKAWLYFDYDQERDELALETSWLPGDPEVKNKLGPLGFKRDKSGVYRRVFTGERVRQDELAVLRAAQKAVMVILEESV